MPLKKEKITMESPTDAVASSDRSLHVVRRMRKAFLSICRCGDVMFSPYRLTTEQYALMRAVQREPGIRQVDVRESIFAEPNTVTAMVSLLERRGIIRRKPSPLDGRARLLYLTAHGQTVIARLAEEWQPMRALLRKCFAGKAGQEALGILDTVYAEMERERDNLLKKVYIDHPAELGLDGVEPSGSPALKNGRSGKPVRAAGARSRSSKRTPTQPNVTSDVLHS